MRLLQLQVGEQVLQEKNTFLEQEVHHRRQLIRRVLIFVTAVILIIATAAVGLVVLQERNIQILQERNDTCVKWLQQKKVGKYVAR